MELSRFLTAVRGSWRLIVLCAIVAGGVALLASAALPRQYRGEAKVLVGSLTEPNYDQLLAYQQLAQTYAQLATTTPVLARVRDQLGLSDDVQRLAERIDSRSALGQATVRIVATATTPVEASELANAVAAEVTRMAQPAADQPSLATIVQPAVPPESPSSPLVLLDTLVAVVLGLALGVGLALAPAPWLRPFRSVAARLLPARLRRSPVRVEARGAGTAGPAMHRRAGASARVPAGSPSAATAGAAPTTQVMDSGTVPSSRQGDGGPGSASHRRARSTIGTDPLDAPGRTDARLVLESALLDLEAGRPGPPG